MEDVSSSRAVLDTCVLLPMTLRDTLLRAAELGLYHVYWSMETLEELKRNLPGLKSGISEEQVLRGCQHDESVF